MAAFIRVTCNVCGDIKLPIENITIRTCVGRLGGEYRWKCECGIVVRQADPMIMGILRDNGVKEEIWELPLELLEHPTEGTLDEDAIIDLELAWANNTLYNKITHKYLEK